jgi:hypothetical protein
VRNASRIDHAIYDRQPVDPMYVVGRPSISPNTDLMCKDANVVVGDKASFRLRSRVCIDWRGGDLRSMFYGDWRKPAFAPKSSWAVAVVVVTWCIAPLPLGTGISWTIHILHA